MSDCGDVKKVFVPTKDPKQEEAPTEFRSGLDISDVAAEKIKTFLENDGKSISEYGLKIAVKTDGCSGHSYLMDLALVEPCREQGDKIFEKDGANVMVEKSSYLFVTGSILDYTEALTGSGFTLNNPNIKKTCSCGASFAV